MKFPVPLTLTFILSFTAAVSAQVPKSTDSDQPVSLDRVDVTADRVGQSAVDVPVFPVTASVTAQRIDDTVNIVDPEDAVKYFPSIFLRKRNYGDTQATMETRVWGVSSSARSLVYADGVLLSALIANNNNIGGARWGLVAPAEIARIDMMYGPFSAAYPGNSMGAVMEITTRLPEKLEGSVDQTMAWQSFSLYGTKNTFRTEQTAATVGDRAGPFSFWASANYQDSFSQPLSYVTSTTFPTNTTGGYTAFNKLGAPANVLGASGLLHTDMTNAKVKAAYDLTPALRFAYTLGLWQNLANASVQTYLKDASGQPTFAGQSGFASGYYGLIEQHTSQGLSLISDTKGDWDFEAVATLYRMDKDNQRTPGTASATGTTFGTAGKVAVLGGTGWSTVDLKAAWSPGGKTAANTLSFGAHSDLYTLYNPTFNTTDWRSGGPYTSVATEGDGNTRTQALWAQDLWRITPGLKFTAGGRYEEWLAYDGYNVNGATAIRQPTIKASKFSPKAVLEWTVAPKWVATASVGRAYRFATASELYQLVSTGTTYTSPNPNLKPDNDLSSELRLERTFDTGSVRLSLFEDNVHDAIIAQYSTLVPGSPTLYSYNSNVDHVRARGVEFAFERTNVFARGLDFSGSLTYVDARTLATQGQGQYGSAIGKRLPNIPDWRASYVITYRPDDRWAFTLGGRYSGKLYTTLDNVDVNPDTYQGFTSWFVADAHVNYHLTHQWSLSGGVDNLLNRKYFFFHPFPQRTVVMDVKYGF